MYNISANTNFKGKSLIYLPTCHSTNAYAQALISSQNPDEGTLIITPNQTNGKGQLDAIWESEEGKNLSFSLIIRPTFLPVTKQFYLSIISALAVRDCVAHFLNTDVTIKWPNDIYLKDNKIAGILIQNSLKGTIIANSIIGIGLNVNQEQFSDKKAISMKNIASVEFSAKEVLSTLLSNLDTYYTKLQEGLFDELTTLYTSHLYRLNTIHSFKKGDSLFEGKITGIDENGRLKILTEKGVELFNNKEVTYIFCY